MPRSVDELAHRHIRENYHGNSTRTDYSLRCPCVKIKMNCSSLCLFKDCTNKYGKRPPPSKLEIVRSMTIKSFHFVGSTFLNDIGESVKVGPLTLLELRPLQNASY